MSKIHMQNLKRSVKGFTLVELMIVVAIIGILAGIAIPGYADYVRRGKATEATSTLGDLKSRMEQYYQDNHTYVNTGGLVAPCAPAVGSVKYFSFACTTQTVDTFTLTATPLPNVDMNNFQFTINESGRKTSIFDGASCNTRWLTSKTSTC